MRCHHADDSPEDRARRVKGWPKCSDAGAVTHAVRSYFKSGRDLLLCDAHVAFLTAINPFGSTPVRLPKRRQSARR